MGVAVWGGRTESLYFLAYDCTPNLGHLLVDFCCFIGFATNNPENEIVSTRSGLVEAN
jgi:hypothetical protein